MNIEDFEKWAIAQKSVGNPTEEGSYKGQCVSLVQQYLVKCHNIPFKARGNAKDWANTTIDGFYKTTGKARPYDIIIWNTGQYGHIAIVDHKGEILEQNRYNNKAITVSPMRSGFIAIQRPSKNNHIYMTGNTYTLQVDLKVRTGAGTNYSQKRRSELTSNARTHSYSQTMAVLKTGTRVTVLEIKRVNNETWLRIPSGWICGIYNGKRYVE